MGYFSFTGTLHGRRCPIYVSENGADSFVASFLRPHSSLNGGRTPSRGMMVVHLELATGADLQDPTN